MSAAGQGGTGRSVLALAGRRIDADRSPAPRFAAAAIPAVRRRIASLLAAEDARALVCAAACGADLLALEEAGRLGLRRRVVLPFAPGRFRALSVVDRPPAGVWGTAFDRILAEVAAAGELVVLDGAAEPEAAYAAANRAILEGARALAAPGGDRLVAVAVWEGTPRGADDATAMFRGLARAAGFALRDVPTR